MEGKATERNWRDLASILWIDFCRGKGKDRKGKGGRESSYFVELWFWAEMKGNETKFIETI